MAVKFFGQYLVEQNLVSRERLLEAIELQDKKNLKLGEMALSMGYLTEKDIERAHNAQMSKDMKLGDLLVDMEILTSAQLDDVITRQKNTHLYIGEALVQIGALSPDQLLQHLKAFKADQAQYVSEKIELPVAIANSNIWEMTADLTYKMVTRVLDLQYRPGKCELITTPRFGFVMAAMDFSGDVDARYIISVSSALQKEVAKSILREENVDNESVEVMDDTVMEFVNVVCGNVAAKASQLGTIMNINPPVTIKPQKTGLPLPENHTGLSFPIHIGDGEIMELILFIKN